MHEDTASPLPPTTADVVAAFPELLTARRVSVEDILDTLGQRGLASALLVAASPQMLPFPLGVSNVLAIPAVLVAVQMAVGRRVPWLPAWMLGRTFHRDSVLRTARRLIPVLRAIEVVVQPRLTGLWAGAGTYAVGLAAFTASLIAAVPLPLTGWLPSIALVAIAAGMMERDGLVVMAGMALTAGAVIVLAAVVASMVQLGAALA